MFFPEEYHAKELAGKEATFKCKVHKVEETILPEIDDEFAKDVFRHLRDPRRSEEGRSPSA